MDLQRWKVRSPALDEALDSVHLLAVEELQHQMTEFVQGLLAKSLDELLSEDSIVDAHEHKGLVAARLEQIGVVRASRVDRIFLTITLSACRVDPTKLGNTARHVNLDELACSSCGVLAVCQRGRKGGPVAKEPLRLDTSSVSLDLHCTAPPHHRTACQAGPEGCSHSRSQQMWRGCRGLPLLWLRSSPGNCRRKMPLTRQGLDEVHRG
mmetsp:Transcript_20503/g.46747  ORF Transcript_20503/g.46747 Transcript_20503/m.46747 type:complete len:209 (+) Transcript_20503:2773-3399(+)